MLVNKEQQELFLKEETSKFLNLMCKINKEKPDSKDLQEAEDMVSKNPALWQVGLGYAGTILEEFITKLTPNKALQLILKTEAMDIKENLGYSSSNQLEKLIIDQIMLCWVGTNYAENRVHNMYRQDSFSHLDGVYWQETLMRYQNRYLKAIETLAKVRKMNKAIALQVNIAAEGGKQVNVNNINTA